eukprot:g3007.t1
MGEVAIAMPPPSPLEQFGKALPTREIAFQRRKVQTGSGMKNFLLKLFIGVVALLFVVFVTLGGVLVVSQRIYEQQQLFKFDHETLRNRETNTVAAVASISSYATLPELLDLPIEAINEVQRLNFQTENNRVHSYEVSGFSFGQELDGSRSLTFMTSMDLNTSILITEKKDTNSGLCVSPCSSKNCHACDAEDTCKGATDCDWDSSRKFCSKKCTKDNCYSCNETSCKANSCNKDSCTATHCSWKTHMTTMASSNADNGHCNRCDSRDCYNCNLTDCAKTIGCKVTKHGTQAVCDAGCSSETCWACDMSECGVNNTCVKRKEMSFGWDHGFGREFCAFPCSAKNCFECSSTQCGNTTGCKLMGAVCIPDMSTMSCSAECGACKTQSECSGSSLKCEWVPDGSRSFCRNPPLPCSADACDKCTTQTDCTNAFGCNWAAEKGFCVDGCNANNCMACNSEDDCEATVNDNRCLWETPEEKTLEEGMTKFEPRCIENVEECDYDVEPDNSEEANCFNCNTIEFGEWKLVGNGFCDERNNNARCNWDGGDCCQSSCGRNSEDSKVINICKAEVCNAKCLDTPRNNHFGCPNYDPCVMDMGGDPSKKGDGHCDWENNNKECNFDDGDCCHGTCNVEEGAKDASGNLITRTCTAKSNGKMQGCLDMCEDPMESDETCPKGELFIPPDIKEYCDDAMTCGVGGGASCGKWNFSKFKALSAANRDAFLKRTLAWDPATQESFVVAIHESDDPVLLEIVSHFPFLLDFLPNNIKTQVMLGPVRMKAEMSRAKKTGFAGKKPAAKTNHSQASPTMSKKMQTALSRHQKEKAENLGAIILPAKLWILPSEPCSIPVLEYHRTSGGGSGSKTIVEAKLKTGKNCEFEECKEGEDNTGKICFCRKKNNRNMDGRGVLDLECPGPFFYNMTASAVPGLGGVKAMVWSEKADKLPSKPKEYIFDSMIHSESQMTENSFTLDIKGFTIKNGVRSDRWQSISPDSTSDVRAGFEVYVRSKIKKASVKYAVQVQEYAAKPDDWHEAKKLSCPCKPCEQVPANAYDSTECKDRPECFFNEVENRCFTRCKMIGNDETWCKKTSGCSFTNGECISQNKNAKSKDDAADAEKGTVGCFCAKFVGKLLAAVKTEKIGMVSSPVKEFRLTTLQLTKKMAGDSDKPPEGKKKIVSTMRQKDFGNDGEIYKEDYEAKLKNSVCRILKKRMKKIFAQEMFDNAVVGVTGDSAQYQIDADKAAEDKMKNSKICDDIQVTLTERGYQFTVYASPNKPNSASTGTQRRRLNSGGSSMEVNSSDAEAASQILGNPEISTGLGLEMYHEGILKLDDIDNVEMDEKNTFVLEPKVKFFSYDNIKKNSTTLIAVAILLGIIAVVICAASHVAHKNHKKRKKDLEDAIKKANEEMDAKREAFEKEVAKLEKEREELKRLEEAVKNASDEQAKKNLMSELEKKKTALSQHEAHAAEMKKQYDAEQSHREAHMDLERERQKEKMRKRRQKKERKKQMKGNAVVPQPTQVVPAETTNVDM